LGTLGLIISVFWLIGVPNIVNLIDGWTGWPPAGADAFLHPGLCELADGANRCHLGQFRAGGVLLGFLCFNFPPAKISSGMAVPI